MPNKEKIQALKSLLYDGKIDTQFFHSQMNILLGQKSQYSKDHVHFYDRNQKVNTRGYSNVMHARRHG